MSNGGYFIIGHSTTQKSVAPSRRELRTPNNQHGISNVQRRDTSSLDIPCSLLDIQLLKNGSRFHEEHRTPNIEHGISNIQPPLLHHWTFLVRYWIFSYSKFGHAFTKSIEHPISSTEFPISNGGYFIIGHSLFVIGHSTTQNSVALSRRASNTQYPISNRLSFIIGHSLFVIGYSLHWIVDLSNFPTHESRRMPALSKADLSAA